MHVSLILPAYNEEANLQQVINECMTELKHSRLTYHIFAVDDGSTDRTAELISTLAIQNNCLTGIYLKENLGFGGAVRAGILYAKVSEMVVWKTDHWLVIMDADGQLKLSDWLRCEPWLEPDIDLWWGIRERRAEGIGRKVISRVYNTLCRVALGTPEVEDVDCGLKAIRSQFIPDDLPSVRGATINPVLFASALRQGAKVRQFAVRHLLRQYGHPTGLSPKVITRSLKELVALAVRKKAYGFKCKELTNESQS
ncbi:glycosyl transferase [Desulfosporosinus acidiphilus SJ4]|uniref:Glycosyl transferase n=1 Tax=Desulfosporosinus acidiphilus (strain DSM 22704 / JCM 16185 / SJ4) TaxID=646529 RepID=I4DAW9_DESAJ|nr:glycosyltransferase family 2 protein [Desulfosporosinus acidiphilus]AFM42943.1 glycosyl transferase [Desulfosporosinus acidiphilus SJ4]